MENKQKLDIRNLLGLPTSDSKDERIYKYDVDQDQDLKLVTD